MRIDADTLGGGLLDGNGIAGFAELTSLEPTARIVDCPEPLWIRLGTRSARSRESGTRVPVAVTRDGVLACSDTARLCHVLDAAGHPGAVQVPAQARPALPAYLGAMFGDEPHRRVEGPAPARASCCAEILLSTAEAGPFVPTGAVLDAPLAVWRNVLAAGGWYADVAPSGADRAARRPVPRLARVVIARIELAPLDIEALSVGDLLLCDLERFRSGGDCTVVLGSMQRDAILAAGPGEGRLGLEMSDDPPLEVPARAREANDSTCLDIVAGFVRVDPIDWLIGDAAPARADVPTALPVVSLSVGARSIGRGELVDSQIGLVLRIVALGEGR